ncbi:MAG TPA: M48 family peptidase [Bacteroidetes bacterium]|nr:M48 family peptidase [Bacteroidota bacterium]
MENLIFYLIIGILLMEYLVERILGQLNLNHYQTTVPRELRKICDEEKYRQAREYYVANHRFSMVTSGFHLLLILGMLVFGGFALVDHWVHQIAGHPVWVTLLFFGILMLASSLINIPFEAYDTFVIEEKFGFNRTTVKTFIADHIKSWILGGITGGGILALVVWFWTLTGPSFWLWAWGLITLFSLFITMFYSTLIVPLFNKQRPLEEGSLRNAIESFTQKAGFRLDSIYVIDSSRRSTKSNAYFSGLGRKKRVVLFDTLIDEMSEEEIVAILAHEVGHYKKKHIWKGLLAGTAQTGLTLFLLSLLINEPVTAGVLGTEQHGFHTGLLVFGLLYSPVSTLLGIVMNRFSRKNEFQADAFAREQYNGEALASALKKLSVKNLSNMNPHPLYVFVHYSHPPLLERIKRLQGRSE